MEDKAASLNRQAYHHYHILETFEAGMVLQGTEVKSIRQASQSQDSYRLVKNGEIRLLNYHQSLQPRDRMNTIRRSTYMHRNELPADRKNHRKGRRWFHQDLFSGRAKCEIAWPKVSFTTNVKPKNARQQTKHARPGRR
jgi:tmRNA-binding protein